MNFDIAIITHWDDAEIELCRLIGEVLTERGHDICFINISPKGKQATELVGKQSINLQDKIPEELPETTQLEADLGIPSFQFLYFTEMKLRGLTLDRAERRTRELGGAYARVLDRHSFDYTFQSKGSEIHRMLAHFFTVANGGTSIWRVFSPFDGKRSLSTRLDTQWYSYETIPYSDIEEMDREQVRTHIEAYLDNQRLQDYIGDDDDGSVLRRHLLGRLPSLLNPERPTNRVNMIKRKMREKSYRAINSRLLPSVPESRRLCESSSFVYLPLQYPIESRLTTISPEFFNQQHVIEYLSRILPHDLELFVKQHPNHVGYQSPALVRTLSKKHNVRFLHPNMNTHEIVQHADLVTVINSTVGFEAIYHRKPLVVLGTAFYDQTPAATNVDVLSDLPMAIVDLAGETISEKTMIESIHSLQAVSIPDLYGDIVDGADRDDISAELEEVVDRILDIVEESPLSRTPDTEQTT